MADKTKVYICHLSKIKGMVLFMNRAGEKVKKIREDAKLSQKQFAKKLGVAEKFINEIECGRKVVTESLIHRIKKLYGKDINDINMSADEEEEVRETNYQFKSQAKKKETNEVWTDALSSILKSVPVYDYSFKKVIDKRSLPVIANKIEGFNQDKVFFIKIENNDMTGFRIMKDDVAFGHMTSEIENNAICLIEYNDLRVLRQIKRLDNNKLLLISNNGNLMTQTVQTNEIKIDRKSVV